MQGGLIATFFFEKIIVDNKVALLYNKGIKKKLEGKEMTIAEKKMLSVQKEVEKLQKSVSRLEGVLTKKAAKCEKLNCNWTQEEFYQHRDADMTDEQWSRWFEMSVTRSDLEDTKERLVHACKRLDRETENFLKVAERIEQDEEMAQKELSWLENMQKSEEEFYKWLSQFKAECLKDGITIKDASRYGVIGFDARGKRFYLGLNDGWTDRSFHCYSLKIEGIVIFTSGLFSTAYRYLMAK